MINLRSVGKSCSINFGKSQNMTRTPSLNLGLSQTFPDLERVVKTDYSGVRVGTGGSRVRNSRRTSSRCPGNVYTKGNGPTEDPIDLNRCRVHSREEVCEGTGTSSEPKP